MITNEKHKRGSFQDTSSYFENVSDIEPRKRARKERVVHECVNLVTVHGQSFALMDDIAFKNIIKVVPSNPGANHYCQYGKNQKNCH